MIDQVILHEYDHVIGKMIPDRVTSNIKKGLFGELNNIVDRRAEADDPLTEKARKLFR